MLAILNDRIADGRDVSWVWDADFEMLAGRARRVTCAGTRAAELALRLKYAGVEVERLEVVPPLPTRSTLLSPTAPDGRLFAVPTYTALLELRQELQRRGHVGRVLVSPTGRHGHDMKTIWHDLECGGYVEDLEVWRGLARRQGGPVLDVGAGTGRVTLDLARAGYAVTALDVCDELLATLRERAAGLDVATVAADARSFALDTASPCASCRCRRSSSSAGRTGAPGSSPGPGSTRRRRPPRHRPRR